MNALCESILPAPCPSLCGKAARKAEREENEGSAPFVDLKRGLETLTDGNWAKLPGVGILQGGVGE